MTKEYWYRKFHPWEESEVTIVKWQKSDKVDRRPTPRVSTDKVTPDQRHFGGFVIAILRKR